MSGAPTPLTPAEARASRDAQVASVARPLLAVTALLLVGFTIATPFVTPYPQSIPIALSEALLALVFMGATWGLRRPGAERFVHAIFGALTFSALANVMFSYYATGNALLTTGVVLLVVGAGVIALSWPWMIAIAFTYTAGWLVVLYPSVPFEQWQQVLFALIATDMVALMAHAARYRTHLKLEALRRHEARQRSELEEGLRALREVEARLRSVVGSAPVILLATDATGRVTLAEGRELVARGWDRAQIVGRQAQEMLAVLPEERERLLLALQGQAASGMTERDGRWFETFWTPASAEDGSPEGAIAVAIDVTERVRAEETTRKAEERERAIERLEEMDRFKTDILNTASHELNTPLTPIKLQMHLLKRSASTMDPQQQKAISLLDRNVERLAMLVSDIMDVARLQGGQLRMAPADVDLAELTRDAGASYEDVAAEKAIKLVVDAPASIPLRADPKRVLQVLFNLIGNAMKFTPEGGTITLSARADGKVATIAVRDTGPGLTGEQIARLFRPFSQVHDPSRTSYGGTGLGLYISRGIAQQHAGELSCESDGPGKGTTFTLTLPV